VSQLPADLRGRRRPPPGGTFAACNTQEEQALAAASGQLDPDRDVFRQGVLLFNQAACFPPRRSTSC